MLERLFKLSENGTDIRSEVVGGSTTFATMAYIIFVQPAVLSAAGMDFGAVMVATCISSAVACFAMAFLANYPVALAPAMGHNFYFTFTVCVAMGVPWQKALAAVFVAGAIFMVLSVFRFRSIILSVIPRSLQSAIAVGIGLLIAFVGLQWAGLVVDAPGTLVTLGDLSSRPVLLSLAGLLATSVLLVLGVQGALLIGILFTAIGAVVLGLVRFQGIASAPPSLSPTFLQLDFSGLFSLELITVVIVFLYLDIFDTVGTLVGVAHQAGLMKDGELPRSERALFADATGTTVGALLGTSTVTSYIESAAGVAQGSRTGLSNLVTGALFLIALFFHPLVSMIGGGTEIAPGTVLYPVTAPVLIIVGSLMLKSIRNIPLDDPSEAIPAFLTMLGMPLFFSISDGLALGLVSYAILKLFSGQGRKVSPLIYVLAVLFALRYAFLG
ncbi:MAG: NCS2 family permease [Candidatus Eisenbacteria sp.]|nr:NCS2 family permease [Candidatus Eisenbacteria bacterium]